MRKNRFIFALTIFIPIMLSGCGNQQPADQEKSGSANRVTLSVVPGSISACKKDARIDPVVTWQTKDTSVKNIKVTVISPGSADEKLFATGGEGGSAKAGDWVVAGVTFHLYDADTGTALTSYTVSALPCTHAQ